MGTINKPEKVKLFAGIIYNKYCKIEEINSELVKLFDEVDLSSEEMTFDFTDYYNDEMQGPPLYKKIYSFKNLIEMEDLAQIKTFTNNIEQKFSLNGKRNCNIDPGYLCLSKLILASTKEFYHRIYIGNNIFAELTLYYKDNEFQTLPWTYPDFKTKLYQDYFKKIRKIYKEQLKKIEYIK